MWTDPSITALPPRKKRKRAVDAAGTGVAAEANFTAIDQVERVVLKSACPRSRVAMVNDPFGCWGNARTRLFPESTTQRIPRRRKRRHRSAYKGFGCGPARVVALGCARPWLDCAVWKSGCPITAVAGGENAALSAGH